MPFERRTLTQIRDGVLADLSAAEIYDGTTGQVVNPALLRYDPLTIQAILLAGLVYEQYGYLDYLALQATPATATDEYALAWGALVRVTLKPAQQWIGSVLVSGTAGRDIPAGTQFSRGDGALYASTADVIMPAAGSVSVPIISADFSAAASMTPGVDLSVAMPILGITTECVVDTSLQPGTDIEDPDDFKARYLLEYGAPGQGGDRQDYLEWALAVPGVTRAWVQAEVDGPGSVGIYVMLDISRAATGGFPVGTDGISPLDNNGRPRDSRIAAGDQLAVTNALVDEQPVTDRVYGLAPTASPIGFTIANLGAANTAANQAAIAAALGNALLVVGDPRGTTIQPSVFEQAIAEAIAPATFFMSAPSGPVSTPLGFLPTVGALSFP